MRVTNCPCFCTPLVTCPHNPATPARLPPPSSHPPKARAAGVPLRVSGISPGLVETEFFTVRAFGDDSKAKAATSQFKCLDPADVARAVVWCLSAPPHMEVNDVIVRPTQQVI